MKPNEAATPQPPPQANERPHIADLVIADILSRKAAGVRKYGTPLQAGNGRDALMDAYQEALDLAQYLKQEMEERRECEDDLRREGAVAALRWVARETRAQTGGIIAFLHHLENYADRIESGEVKPWAK